MNFVVNGFQNVADILGVEPFTISFLAFILLAAVIPAAMRKYDCEIPVVSRAAISGLFILTAFIVSDYIVWTSETNYSEITLPYLDHLVFQVVDQMLGWAVLLTILILFGLGIVVGSVGSFQRFMEGDFDLEIFND